MVIGPVNASSYLPIEKLSARCRKSFSPDRQAVSEFRPTVSKCSENVAKHPKFYFATICNEGCSHCQLHLLGKCGMMTCEPPWSNVSEIWRREEKRDFNGWTIVVAFESGMDARRRRASRRRLTTTSLRHTPPPTRIHRCLFRSQNSIEYRRWVCVVPWTLVLSSYSAISSIS